MYAKVEEKRQGQQCIPHVHCHCAIIAVPILITSTLPSLLSSSPPSSPCRRHCDYRRERARPEGFVSVALIRRCRQKAGVGAEAALPLVVIVVPRGRCGRHCRSLWGMLSFIVGKLSFVAGVCIGHRGQRSWLVVAVDHRFGCRCLLGLFDADVSESKAEASTGGEAGRHRRVSSVSLFEIGQSLLHWCHHHLQSSSSCQSSSRLVVVLVVLGSRHCASRVRGSLSPCCHCCETRWCSDRGKGR
jgi:hypothetical protein